MVEVQVIRAITFSEPKREDDVIRSVLSLLHLLNLDRRIYEILKKRYERPT